MCIELCKQKHPKLFQARQKRSFDLTAKLLRWSRDDKIGDLRKLLSGASFDTDRAYPNFDVIIASDCLFFKDFHHDLYWLLKAAIAPGGVVFLLQPRRGRTLDIFIDIVKSDNFFSFEISDNYLCEVGENVLTYQIISQEFFICIGV